jgi:hypothetical protein
LIDSIRNLQTGLRGLRNRQKATPNSEFTLRRILRNLARWCTEATAPDGVVSNNEYRLYLLGRLLRETKDALDVCLTHPRLFSRLGVMIKEVQLHSSVQVVLDWLSAQNAGDIKPYVRSLIRHTETLSTQVERRASSRFHAASSKEAKLRAPATALPSRPGSLQPEVSFVYRSVKDGSTEVVR